MARPTIRSVLWDIGGFLQMMAAIAVFATLLTGVFAYGPALIEAIINTSSCLR